MLGFDRSKKYQNEKKLDYHNVDIQNVISFGFLQNIPIGAHLVHEYVHEDQENFRSLDRDMNPMVELSSILKVY